MISVMIGIIGCIVLLISFFAISLKKIPDTQYISDTVGNIIHYLPNDVGYRQIALNYENIPSFYLQALLQIEDQRFYTHQGVDLRAIVRATQSNIHNASIKQGASTINMQLVRNILWLNAERNYWRKGREAIQALYLDIRYQKNQIITHYVNILSYGYNNQGLAAGSLWYFDKNINETTIAEQLGLIVIGQNASRYDPYSDYERFYNRYLQLNEYLYANNYISEEQFLYIKNYAFILRTNHDWKLPYLVDTILYTVPYQGDNTNIATTIDMELSNKLEAIAKKTIMDMQRKNVNDYGILVVDRESLEIRVLQGGFDYYNDQGQVNAVFAKRQPGSALKPFTYLLALKEGIETKDSILIDAPVQFQTAMGFGYSPKNFSLQYKGHVSFGQALAESLNVPAIKLAHAIGTEKLLSFYRENGLSSLTKSADYYGLALTLGVGEVSLYELLQAYTIFTQQGNHCSFVLYKDQDTICKKIVDASLSDQIATILSNRSLRRGSFPIHSTLDFADVFVGLKSGTSRNFADTWVVGFTNNYLIGVRVGNKNGSNMKGVSGAQGAGEVFAKIVYALEPREYIPEDIAPQTRPIDRVQIKQPLPYSVYKIDNARPIQQQLLYFDISYQGLIQDIDRTLKNIDTDTIVANRQGKQNTRVSRKLQTGNYSLSLSVKINNKKIEQTNTFSVIE